MGMSRARDCNCLHANLIAGTTAMTNIALSGAEVGDEIIFVGHITLLAAVATLADLTSEGSITSAGYFQMSSTSTANDQLWVFWNDKSGGIRARDANCFKVALVTGGTAVTQLTCAGIEVGDEIIFCGEFATAASILTFTDRTSVTTIPAAGKILTSNNTTSNQLLVIYNDLSGGADTFDACALRIGLYDGSTAAANIAVAASGGLSPISGSWVSTACEAIATEDKIISELVFTSKAAVESCADLTSECSITSAGNIQNASTDTSSNLIMLFWLDKSA